MGLALDEPHDDDESFEIDGLSVVVGPRDSSYITGGQGVRVDYTTGFFGSGFWVARRGGYATGCC